ncbi:MAG: V-type ATPase subunit [Euryarchaeota archaeon]|nr:V-type ATPase subunit [Euryarchaeota archaeon]
MISVDWNTLMQWLLGEGLPYLILLIVLVAGLFVFIFITTLFPTMRQIISFAYLNSLIAVLGRKHIDRAFLEELYDSRDIISVVQNLRSAGVEVELSEDPRMLEKYLINDFISKMKLIEKHIPKLIEPFFKAYKRLIVFEELIKAIRTISSGVKPDLTIMQALDPRMASLISGVSSYDSLRSALSTIGISLPEDPVEGERELFLMAIRGLDDSSRLVDESVAGAVKEFMLNYKDYYNILIILRGITLGLSSEYIESLTLGEGMYLSKWTLHKLSEATSINEVIAELQGTPYEEELKGLVIAREKIDLSLIEASISRGLMRIMSMLEHKYSLTAGPLMRFLTSLSFGIRNLRLGIYGVVERIPKERLLKMAVYG